MTTNTRFQETLKTMILDFQEMALETGIQRRIRLEPIAKKATVCIGVRRCGKSTLLYQLIDGLLQEGISAENILYLNFFDDRLHGMEARDLDQVLEAYFSCFPHKKRTENIYCFFDEIQNISGWEPFVDRLIRTEKCRVYITGSSAMMLSKEIATQMRGRANAYEIFPFSFREFLDFTGIDSDKKRTTKQRLLIQNALDSYLDIGGFPEVLGLSPHLRIKIHQEYFSALLFRDVIERYDISHPKAVSDLAHRLVDNAASLYSVNRLTNYLKSIGHRAPKSAVSNYLQWFEDAYFIFSVPIFDASISRRNTNPKKAYCIDHGLIRSVSSNVLLNTGHILENLVYTALRRQFPEIYYYKSKAGREVDFIVPRRKASPILVQVCETLLDPKTRQREIAALAQAMAENNVSSGIVVTRHETDAIDVEAGSIQVTPAWRFLLDVDRYSQNKTN